MDTKNIAIRLEGGIGDHLLANRFVHAIKNKYKNCNFSFFSDPSKSHSEKEINLLKINWPSIYNDNNCKLIQRKSNNFIVRSQFGEEVYNCHPLNISDEYIKLFNSADRYYNLCIDNLEWLYYDFDWKNYFYFFPTPEKTTNSFNYSNYILTHLYPRPDSDHNLEQGYVIQLIKNLLNKGQKIISICQSEHMHFYQKILDLNNDNFKLIDCSLSEVFELSSKCLAFIGVDSGLRYFPLHYGKPTYVFSKYCNNIFSPAPSHTLRWLIFEKYVIPMHFDINTVCSLIINSTLHPACSLFPVIGDKIENAIIQRYYN